MQDTSPAESQPRDPEAPRGSRAAETWFENGADEPADEPLIALLPLPEQS
jgi:hypothetical protein